MDKVLCSERILESILLLVDQRTLLASAIRVCRRWHTLIAQSTPLQQHLFFEPIPVIIITTGTETTTTISEGQNNPQCLKRRLNPLLQQTFPFSLFFQFPRFQPDIWAGFAHQPSALAALLSPSSYSPSSSSPSPSHNAAKAKAITRKGASWRRMLLFQHEQPTPPPSTPSSQSPSPSQELELELERRPPPPQRLGIIRSQTAYHTATLDFPNGLIRMGTLYDLVYDHTITCRNANPASWVVAWRPPLSAAAAAVPPSEEGKRDDDIWTVDDTVGYWMEKSRLEVALFLVGFDGWGAKLLGLRDGRMEGLEGLEGMKREGESEGHGVDWEGLRCEEYEEVKVDFEFYFLGR